MSLKTEDKSITWLRAIAVIMVVVQHVCNEYVNINNSMLSGVAIFIRIFNIPAVPLFAMISGHLLFSNPTDFSIETALKRFWTVFKIIAYFGVVFYIWGMFHGYGYWHIFRVFMTARFGGMWYMFAILPIYTLSSFIYLPNNLTQKQYIQILFIVCIIWFMTNGSSHAPFHYRLEYSLNILLIYMLIGFIVRKINFPKKASLYFIGFLIISLVISLLFLTSNPRNEGYISIASIFVFVQTILIFLAFSSLDFGVIIKSKFSRLFDGWLAVCAKYSVGIFGWHTPFILRGGGGLQTTLEQYNLRDYQVFLIMLFTAPLFSLIISICDTWLWQKMRRMLKPIFNPILEWARGYL